MAIWFALMLFLIKNLNIGTLITRWAEMPSRIGQLASSVESLAVGLKDSNAANNSEHREFRDSLKDQSHTLSNIEQDLTELKAELLRRLDG